MKGWKRISLVLLMSTVLIFAFAGSCLAENGPSGLEVGPVEADGLESEPAGPSVQQDSRPSAVHPDAAGKRAISGHFPSNVPYPHGGGFSVPRAGPFTGPASTSDEGKQGQVSPSLGSPVILPSADPRALRTHFPQRLGLPHNPLEGFVKEIGGSLGIEQSPGKTVGQALGRAFGGPPRIVDKLISDVREHIRQHALQFSIEDRAYNVYRDTPVTGSSGTAGGATGATTEEAPPVVILGP